MTNQFVVCIKDLNTRSRSFYRGSKVEGYILSNNLTDAKKYKTLAGAKSGLSALFNILHNINEWTDFYLEIWTIRDGKLFINQDREGPF